MYDSPEELLAKIRLGEDSTIEFKSVRFKGTKPELSRDSLADEIAAFANSADGVLLFGIDDKSRAVEGIPLEHLDNIEAMVSELVNDVVKPSVYVRILKMTLPNEMGISVPVLKVDIPRSLFVHKSPGGYFHRLGDKKRELSPEALARLFQQRSQTRLIRFDEQPVPGTSIMDLDESLWKRFAGVASETIDTTLEKLKLIANDDSGIARITVSGVLLATRSPHDFMSNALIEAVTYRSATADSNYQVDALTIKGPLDEQVRQCMAFAKRNMKTAAFKDPGRVEVPQYSLRAIFEAVVNAVAHRDYSLHGSKIRFFMFPDRLEIYSPGAIPNSMTIASMPLRQSTRNELITSLLARCPVDASEGALGRQLMMEKRGEGVPIIFEETIALTGQRPEFRLIDEVELLVTIPSAQLRPNE
ncbi:MAG: ATP-binding protein [Rectinemataceae bacterium]